MGSRRLAAFISSGGYESISSGGMASGTQVKGGYEIISGGGIARGTVISAGYQSVSSGGVASGAQVKVRILSTRRR